MASSSPPSSPPSSSPPPSSPHSPSLPPHAPSVPPLPASSSPPAPSPPSSLAAAAASTPTNPTDAVPALGRRGGGGGALGGAGVPAALLQELVQAAVADVEAGVARARSSVSADDGAAGSLGTLPRGVVVGAAVREVQRLVPAAAAVCDELESTGTAFSPATLSHLVRVAADVAGLAQRLLSLHLGGAPSPPPPPYSLLFHRLPAAAAAYIARTAPPALAAALRSPTPLLSGGGDDVVRGLASLAALPAAAGPYSDAVIDALAAVSCHLVEDPTAGLAERLGALLGVIERHAGDASADNAALRLAASVAVLAWCGSGSPAARSAAAACLHGSSREACTAVEAASAAAVQRALAAIDDAGNGDGDGTAASAAGGVAAGISVWLATAAALPPLALDDVPAWAGAFASGDLAARVRAAEAGVGALLSALGATSTTGCQHLAAALTVRACRAMRERAAAAAAVGSVLAACDEGTHPLTPLPAGTVLHRIPWPPTPGLPSPWDLFHAQRGGAVAAGETAAVTPASGAVCTAVRALIPAAPDAAEPGVLVDAASRAATLFCAARGGGVASDADGAYSWLTHNDAAAIGSCLQAACTVAGLRALARASTPAPALAGLARAADDARALAQHAAVTAVRRGVFRVAGAWAAGPPPGADWPRSAPPATSAPLPPLLYAALLGGVDAALAGDDGGASDDEHATAGAGKRATGERAGSDADEGGWGAWDGDDDGLGAPDGTTSSGGGGGGDEDNDSDSDSDSGDSERERAGTGSRRQAVKNMLGGIASAVAMLATSTAARLQADARRRAAARPDSGGDDDEEEDEEGASPGGSGGAGGMSPAVGGRRATAASAAATATAGSRLLTTADGISQALSRMAATWLPLLPPSLAARALAAVLDACLHAACTAVLAAAAAARDPLIHDLFTTRASYQRPVPAAVAARDSLRTLVECTPLVARCAPPASPPPPLRSAALATALVAILSSDLRAVAAHLRAARAAGTPPYAGALQPLQLAALLRLVFVPTFRRNKLLRRASRTSPAAPAPAATL